MDAPHILRIVFGAFCSVTLATTSPALIIECIALLCVIGLVVLIIFFIGAAMIAHRHKEEEKKGK